MNAPHFGALFWSQWLADDLPWGRRLSATWHLRRCPTCRAAAQALRCEQVAYSESASFAQGLADLQRRQDFTIAAQAHAKANPAWLTVRRKRPARAVTRLAVFNEALRHPSALAAAPWKRLPQALARLMHVRPWPALGWACALAVAIMAVGRLPGDATPLRPKGAAAHFSLYVQRGADVSPLGDTCRPGDALRAGYQSSMPYLLVAEIDGDGTMQVVFPAGGTASTPITAARQWTPGSWVLDGSSNRERFVALFSQRPLKVAAVDACLHAAAACDADVVRREVACRKE